MEEVSGFRYQGTLTLCGGEGQSVLGNATHMVSLQRVGCSSDEAKKSLRYKLNVRTHFISSTVPQSKILAIFRDLKDKGDPSVTIQELLKVDPVELAQSLPIIGSRIFQTLDMNLGCHIDLALFAVLIQMSAAVRAHPNVRSTAEAFFTSEKFSSATAFYKLPYLSCLILKNVSELDPVSKMASQALLYGLEFILFICACSIPKDARDVDAPSFDSWFMGVLKQTLLSAPASPRRSAAVPPSSSTPATSTSYISPPTQSLLSSPPPSSTSTPSLAPRVLWPQTS